jgi:hypothetical protein
MIAPDNFGALILTHGRPDNQKTATALRKHGYTGPIVYLIDDEDPTAERYFELYGDSVVQFSKEVYSQLIDECDNFTNRRSILYARNASYDIAKSLGWTHFIQLDDDYGSFVWKFNRNLEYKEYYVNHLDGVFSAFVRFLESTNVATIAMAQGGDFIGGGMSRMAKSLNIGTPFRRKAMNTFVCTTERRIDFVCRINEDVSTYTWRGSVGMLFFTTNLCMVHQTETQTNPGGLTEFYLQNGTYVKSFYSVICMPSSVKISAMSSNHARIHHKVTWRNTVPAILDERHRKIGKR